MTLPLQTPPAAATTGMQPAGTTVIGLDLSLTSTGIATTQHTAVIRPRNLTGLDRIRRIEVEIGLYLETLPVDDPADLTVAIEGPTYSKLEKGAHERGGLWWHIVGHLDNLGSRIVVVSPSLLKKYATGKGNAGKDEMLLAASRRFDWFAGGNDEADALWLAAVAAELAGRPVVQMPAANRTGLADKVSWIRQPVAA